VARELVSVRPLVLAPVLKRMAIRLRAIRVEDATGVRESAPVHRRDLAPIPKITAIHLQGVRARAEEAEGVPAAVVEEADQVAAARQEAQAVAARREVLGQVPAAVEEETGQVAAARREAQAVAVRREVLGQVAAEVMEIRTLKPSPVCISTSMQLESF
jgi:hypothetical protein